MRCEMIKCHLTLIQLSVQKYQHSNTVNKNHIYNSLYEFKHQMVKAQRNIMISEVQLSRVLSRIDVALLSQTILCPMIKKLN